MSKDKEIAQEDVRTICLEAFEVIKKGLEKHGISMTDDQEDEVYVPLTKLVDKQAGYPDYRNYN